jgi:HTH-type transcriptional regulator / antitoxin MqsA
LGGWKTQTEEVLREVCDSEKRYAFIGGLMPPVYTEEGRQKMSDLRNTTCPACLSGTLKRHAFQSSVVHAGVKDAIQQAKLVCSHCGIELFDETCSRENRRSLVVFQKRVDGVPTGAEIKAMRLRAKLSSERAGRLLGGGPKAFSKYENEEIVPTGGMLTIMRLLIAYPAAINLVLAAKGEAMQSPVILFAAGANVIARGEVSLNTEALKISEKIVQLDATGVLGVPVAERRMAMQRALAADELFTYPTSGSRQQGRSGLPYGLSSINGIPL